MKSDTVRGVIPTMIYHFLNEPEGLKKLKDELTSIDIRNYNDLQQLPYLSTCIYEMLRLHPPVPSTALRLAPPGGLVVAGKFIPEGTTIATLQYSLFQDLNSFLIKVHLCPGLLVCDICLSRQGSFSKYGLGRFSCLGKSMSLMELRVAIALILTNFNIDFTPGEYGSRMIAEISDCFTTAVGPMQVVMKARTTE
ncbi:cytochrome P450 [Aspergillus costaricaensis CBS 115574]|uniref:Cytochrome P450 n=1 Tax=Aspergillus costaricaensis CBS 115574 TaxID=1448317 RepID=A0ACD1IT90_9EURO|nr:cytochrome P450 [Aspergillus costaricaensis CBS 115574]RAK93466.1 cytochrome P450 [Aspergillus costaricaensis CBS 115574]